MITFYIVRHGRTLFNDLHRMQGWCDSPLLESGIKQGHALHLALRDIPFVAAYSSTSERAIDTAMYIIGDRNDIPFYTSKKLKEFHFGTFEGARDDEIPFSDRKEYFKRGFLKEGGETLAMLQERLFTELQDIADTTKTGNVLIVTHGGAISSIIDKLDPALSEEMIESGKKVSNASITFLQYEDGVFSLGKVNDTTYRNEGLVLLKQEEA